MSDYEKRINPQTKLTNDKLLSEAAAMLDLTQVVKAFEPLNSLKTGVKHDQEKPDMSLLSSVALRKVAEVMTFGKKKYSAHNWRGGIAYSRLIAACLRHITAYNGGEDKDPETGLSHLAHASCCLMMLLEFEETQPTLDDRYKPVK